MSDDHKVEKLHKPKPNAKLDELLGGTTLARRPGESTPGADAVAAALLANILTDIATLKRVMADQLVWKDQKDRWMDTATTLLDGIQGALHRRTAFNSMVVDTLQELDDRLHAIDGKHSLTRDEPANDAAPTGEPG